jgi:hypothetical protein
MRGLREKERRVRGTAIEQQTGKPRDGCREVSRGIEGVEQCGVEKVVRVVRVSWVCRVVDRNIIFGGAAAFSESHGSPCLSLPPLVSSLAISPTLCACWDPWTA